ncbi:TonB-dependent receptor plug domain-containing protein [Campylobacter magnus]|uniref:TonB-dependent receptor plug domain-containing protein n=1 Tax=Campylobacter magnus TaxID=3026462 RepID=UPI002362A68C|nr:TonB-dependent receptor plug domain-containing protein [Campylobacter magnus]MDD0856600.1 TonB-dependent receptor plug domain-containing protein [Campylobacter magnus]
MTKRALSLSVVCTALLSANEQKLDEIVVTASGYEQTIKTAPATVNIVDQKEIKHTQVRQLGDLVKSVPGISTTVEKTGTKGIQIRGFSKDYTLLLVDGFNATGGFISPASLIERVEIVKGPAGGKYASEAI